MNAALIGTRRVHSLVKGDCFFDCFTSLFLRLRPKPASCASGANKAAAGVESAYQNRVVVHFGRDTACRAPTIGVGYDGKCEIEPLRRTAVY